MEVRVQKPCALALQRRAGSWASGGQRKDRIPQRVHRAGSSRLLTAPRKHQSTKGRNFPVYRSTLVKLNGDTPREGGWPNLPVIFVIKFCYFD